MPKDSIALIGFMATGKTTVGKTLVKRLGNEYRLIETDQLIIQDFGKSIPEIFAEDGEDKFREYEISVYEKVSKLNKVVISCGGGVILNPKNIVNLRTNCHIILLNASIDEIYSRILKNGKKSRPLMEKEEFLEDIKEILKKRQPLYESAADLVIDTSEMNVKKIVDKIVIDLKQIRTH